MYKKYRQFPNAIYNENISGNFCINIYICIESVSIISFTTVIKKRLLLDNN